MPRAISREIEPVETAETFIFGFSPILMTVPLPKLFSSWLMAVSRAFFFSSGVLSAGSAAALRAEVLGAILKSFLSFIHENIFSMPLL